MESTTVPYYDSTTLSYKHLDENEQEERALLKEVNTIALVTFSLLFVLGTIGNGLVISITGFRMKKTVHTVWILNLAIADFIFSFFLLFHVVYIGLDYYWPFGKVMCKLNYAVVFFNLFASICLLTVISIDRCIAVWCPVWAQNRRTPRLASFVVLGVWILALVFFCPDLYFTEMFFDNKANATACVNTYDNNDEEGRRILFGLILFRFIFGFIIPFVIIVVCYGAIVLRLRRDQLSQASKPFKVITAVIVAFFICWFPYHVFSFLAVEALREPRLRGVVSVGIFFSYGLASFNSCLNPILYFCMGHNFKEKVRCSLLSALVNAFTEESNTKTSARSSADVQSHCM
ncbi:chemerin-like receptor 1 [Tiliqua scincoides]|uniref:chemerin-like receptor 1 n=1 Tax=Tiliqua scincoides TaxID=71010 RepID=UPI003462C241